MISSYGKSVERFAIFVYHATEDCGGPQLTFKGESEMKGKTKRIFASLIAFVLLASLIAFFAACGEEQEPGPDVPGDATVVELTVDTPPDVTEYYIGETFDPTGMKIKARYAAWDARVKFHLPPFADHEPPGCCCAQVISGKMAPRECPLFRQTCTPQTPVGPCMVSAEGSCAAAWLYDSE